MIFTTIYSQRLTRNRLFDTGMFRRSVPPVSGLFFLQVISILLIITSQGCKTNSSYENVEPYPFYDAVKLVADTSGLGAAILDTNLQNAWGIAITPTGNIWISSNHKGQVVSYDRSGKPLVAPVAVSSQGARNGGSPSGVVFNSTTDFIIPSTGSASKLIFAQEDGTIAAWSEGDSTRTVATRSANGAVYKGIAIAADGISNYLYLANFKGRAIDVFDRNFQFVTGKSFTDPTIPVNFGPFNIQNINGKLYVLYAKLKPPDNMDDEKGPGNGFVDIYNPDGTLVKRFFSQGVLNSPWGIARAPEGFGQGDQVILIANFGDGLINVFDADGNWLRQLRGTSNAPVTIDGLWAIMFPQNGQPAGDPDQLFFTAGPMNERHGMFGYIIKK